LSKVGSSLQIAKDDGTVLASGTSSTSFTIQPKESILWTGDNSRYIYKGTSPLVTTLSKLDLSSKNDWNVVDAKDGKAVYKITAILDNARTTSDANKDYILAADSPMAIDKAEATGTVHRVYRVKDVQFDASSSNVVDIDSNELILADDNGASVESFAPGQSVYYLVLKDPTPGIDSYAIGGLVTKSNYYLIPRGGSHYALAETLDDALSNNAIDLTSLGVGSNHVFHYELGGNVQINGTLNSLASDDYVASPTAIAQVNAIQIAGSYQAGDVIKIALKDESKSNAESKTLSYNVNSNNLATIRTGLISLINGAAGVGNGADSYLTAAASSVNSQVLTLTAKTAGSPFKLTANAYNSSGNIDTTKLLTIVAVTDNYTPLNQIPKKLLLDAPPATMGALNPVQLTSGLLQREDGSLYGATAFLTSTNNIIISSGVTLPIASSYTLNPGENLYVETISGSTTNGFYYRYAGSIPLTITTGDDLRSSLATQSDLWRQGSGPLLMIVKPTKKSGDFRLQGPSSSSNDLINAKLASGSQSGLKFSVEAPVATFNPSNDVDNDNSLITIDGLNATTGEIVTIRSDANYIATKNDASFITVGKGSISNGSNIWSDVYLPSSTVREAGIITATYYSTNPALAATGRAKASDPLGGLTEGQTVYLRQLADLKSVASVTLKLEPATSNYYVSSNGVDKALRLNSTSNYSATDLSQQIIAAATNNGVNTVLMWNKLTDDLSEIRMDSNWTLMAATAPYTLSATSAATLRSILLGKYGLTTANYKSTLSPTVDDVTKVSLFSDAAATQSLLLNTADTSDNDDHYFKVDYTVTNGSQSVGGISDGQELFAINLGKNRYQFADSADALAAALPVNLLLSQITETTQLHLVENDRTTGVSISSTLSTSNEAESTTQIGVEKENQSLKDYLNSDKAHPYAVQMRDKFSKTMSDFTAKFFKSKDNPAANPDDPAAPEQGKSISGAIAMNFADHKASVTLSSSGKIISTNAPVEIESSIEADFANQTNAEVEQDTSASLGVAFGLSKLTNNAFNVIAGNIQTSQSVSLNSSVTYASHFGENESFGDREKFMDWIQPQSLAGALSLKQDLSDITGLLTGGGFNSYSQVQMHGKDDEDDPTKTNKAELGVGIGLNVSLLTNGASNSISGSINAGDLEASASVSIDYVRGSGQIHFEPSPEKLFKVFNETRDAKKEAAALKASGKSEPKVKSFRSSMSKELLDFGTVAKNGFGASLSVITPLNTARNTFTSSANISLTGKLESTTSQVGRSIGVVAGASSADNIRL
jgi:hypothetical protein